MEVCITIAGKYSAVRLYKCCLFLQ